ncbi:nucleotide sugar dehydrogenase [Listeria booriae]|uniref:Nucleotide sugar dehydrogenase n=1 Tax=Listeria booriae TaxID=1552123 RepID=A0A7X1A5W6_9LIST|nr:nucleotide sugar dehydrogenase [Listeria booriae]MBC2371790.1 nucleotide sugar dehydrogenase [Listeria booriae]
MIQERLLEKITDRTMTVGIIGLGYVGLPLAIAFSSAGYKVVGFDIDKNKVKQLNAGQSYIIDISEDKLKLAIAEGFIATTDFSILSEMDAISICVPTPLTKAQTPDTSYIESAVSQINQFKRQGQLIVLESTTYPGTTEELIEQVFKQEGYQVGLDYFLCFSPERVDPGNPIYNTQNTPKVIGGTTENCTLLGKSLYEKVIPNMVSVSSPKVAEMSKLIENTFRSINIAFVNELAMLSDTIDVDVWESIEAASTKPFGFMKFQPGPGIGGHCIPLDPMYLSWKAKESNFYSSFIDLAQEINRLMPGVVCEKASEALNSVQKSLNGSRVLLLGVAYKSDIDDVRESPALEVYELLREKGALVSVCDPFVPKFRDRTGNMVQTIYTSDVKFALYDLVILLTPHQSLDLQAIALDSQLILDTKNAFQEIANDKIFVMGKMAKKKRLPVSIH